MEENTSTNSWMDVMVVHSYNDANVNVDYIVIMMLRVIIIIAYPYP